MFCFLIFVSSLSLLELSIDSIITILIVSLLKIIRLFVFLSLLFYAYLFLLLLSFFDDILFIMFYFFNIFSLLFKKFLKYFLLWNYKIISFFSVSTFRISLIKFGKNRRLIFLHMHISKRSNDSFVYCFVFTTYSIDALAARDSVPGSLQLWVMVVGFYSRALLAVSFWG